MVEEWKCLTSFSVSAITVHFEWTHIRPAQTVNTRGVEVVECIRSRGDRSEEYYPLLRYLESKSAIVSALLALGCLGNRRLSLGSARLTAPTTPQYTTVLRLTILSANRPCEGPVTHRMSTVVGNMIEATTIGRLRGST